MSAGASAIRAPSQALERCAELWVYQSDSANFSWIVSIIHDRPTLLFSSDGSAPVYPLIYRWTVPEDERKVLVGSTVRDAVVSPDDTACECSADTPSIGPAARGDELVCPQAFCGDRRIPRRDRNGCCATEPAERPGFCDSPQMGAPEAYIQFTPGMITDDGEVTEQGTEAFLRDFMAAFEVFVIRVLTVLPRES